MIRFSWLLMLILLPTFSSAQINFPRVSPDCTLKQTIGLTDITIEYSRPSARGRQVFGTLVPYGRIWRTGANESTKISVSDTVWLAGNRLSPGKYALYTIPGEKEWQIILHQNISHWGDGRTKYNPEEDAFRFTVAVEALNDHQESLFIGFNQFTHQSADLEIRWENTLIAFPITTRTDAQVQEDIQTQIAENPTADTYYQAARYYLEEGHDSATAVEWVDNALKLAGDTYYMHRVRSELLATLGRYEEAIWSAEISKKIAAGQGKDEFVRMNERHIAEWQQKK